MVSLTPNEDRARALPLPKAIAEAQQRPGEEGVAARIVWATVQGHIIACGHELDLRTPYAHIVEATIIAIANILGATAKNRSTNPLLLEEIMLARIAEQVRLARDLSDDERNVERFDIARMADA